MLTYMFNIILPKKLIIYTLIYFGYLNNRIDDQALLVMLGAVHAAQTAVKKIRVDSQDWKNVPIYLKVINRFINKTIDKNFLMLVADVLLIFITHIDQNTYSLLVVAGIGCMFTDKIIKPKTHNPYKDQSSERLDDDTNL